MTESTKVWGELWQSAKDWNGPWVAPRQVGDLVPFPTHRHAWDPPSPVYRVVEVLSKVGTYDSTDPANRDGRDQNYCWFRGELVEGHPVQAAVVEPLRRSDDALGEHLSRLNSGD